VASLSILAGTAAKPDEGAVVVEAKANGTGVNEGPKGALEGPKGAREGSNGSLAKSNKADHQKVLEVSEPQAQSDAELVVDGVLTVWRYEDDRQILIRSREQGGTQATFEGLAREMKGSEGGIHQRTAHQIRQRFMFLCHMASTYSNK
jgi:hypothetical protein